MPQVEQNRKSGKQGPMSLLLVLFAYALQVFFLPAHMALGDHLLAEECVVFSTCASADHEEHHVDESHEHEHEHDHGCELFVQRLQPLQSRYSKASAPALPTESSWSPPEQQTFIALTPSDPLDPPPTRHRSAHGSRGPPAAA